jgi:hypothetical protein
VQTAAELKMPVPDGADALEQTQQFVAWEHFSPNLAARGKYFPQAIIGRRSTGAALKPTSPANGNSPVNVEPSAA